MGSVTRPVLSVAGGRVMNRFSHRNPSHRIHTDIQPVLSALRHGKRRIANQRYQALCTKLNLMTWEASVLTDIIRKTCLRHNISFN